MPKRTNKGNRDKKTAPYRHMLDKTEALCKSQVYNELYSRLKKDNRLGRFIAVVQYCSEIGINIDETVDQICQAFPSYIDKKDFTADCFRDMISNYSDISTAWGYGPLGDKISNIIVKNKALSLIEQTDSMTDIQIYQSIFNSTIPNEQSSVDSNNGKTIINFNLGKK